MQSGRNSVSMAAGVMEKALYLSIRLLLLYPSNYGLCAGVVSDRWAFGTHEVDMRQMIR